MWPPNSRRFTLVVCNEFQNGSFRDFFTFIALLQRLPHAGPEHRRHKAEMPCGAQPERFATPMSRVIPIVILVLLASLHLGSIFVGGREWGRVRFGGIWGGKSAIPLGSTYFYAQEGQRVRVQFQATVHGGAFRIWIFRLQPGLGGKLPGEIKVLSSRAGEDIFSVTKNGIHWISIDGQSSGRGYDISYDVTWRIE
jgi:hypothetical protein